MLRVFEKILAADVRENAFSVAFVLSDQFVHQGGGIGDAVLVGVVEGEAHAEDDAALKALVRIGLERGRILVAARVEQIRRDERDFLAVEVKLTDWRSALRQASLNQLFARYSYAAFPS